MLLSVIIPCYNEELVIEETYKRLTSVLGSMQHSYELIFINDGSRDKTYDILFQLSEKDAKVKILHFSRNFGHQCAVTAGINHCNGDAAVIIDSDLQDPPEVIIDMLKIMEEEKANVVYGVRKKRKGETWFKLVTAKYFYRILNSLSDVKFPVDTGDFRLIDRNIIDTFNRMEEKNKYIRGLISWMGYKQVPCYYERRTFCRRNKVSSQKNVEIRYDWRFLFFQKTPKTGYLHRIYFCCYRYPLRLDCLNNQTNQSFRFGNRMDNYHCFDCLFRRRTTDNNWSIRTIHR